MSDLIEAKRAKPPEYVETNDEPATAIEVAVRPTDPAPPASASWEVRQEWAVRFVRWFLSVTGGEVEHPDGAPDGYRWRMEYSDCSRDPQNYEKCAELELAAYQAERGE